MDTLLDTTGLCADTGSVSLAVFKLPGGSVSEFDDFDPFAPEGAWGSGATASMPSSPVPVIPPKHRRDGRLTRRQRVLVTVTSISIVAVGVSLFTMLANLRIHLSSMATASLAGTLFLLASVALFICLLAGIVGIARSERRLAPVLVVVAILVGTPLSALIEVKLGADVAVAQFGSDVQDLVASYGPIAGGILTQLLDLVG